MANQIKYQIGFNVNKSDLNQLKSSLQQLQKIKLDDIMKINKTDMNSARDALKSIQEDASKVENALNKAFNTKLNTLNIDKFNKQLSSSNLTIQKVYQSFSRAGTAGQSAFNNLSTQILNTNVQLRQSSKLLDSMATSMANTIKWGITSSIFNNMTGAIQQAYYYAKDLDRSLTDIRIVTGDSADQMQRFATTANSAAKDLGRSTLDYTKASLTFYQQGLDDQQVAARTEATLKAQNITGIGTEMADYLTAVWNGFNVGAEDAENYVDKLAAVADSTASNMGQLATAMSKVASAANSIGVNVDQLNGQIATVIATTRQAPESVGAAFKTIYARINDIQAGTEDAQVSLGSYSSKMAALGFNVLDATGHLRDTGEVIEEIGGKWQNLTREQQINLAQTMAGQRQYNNLIALFDNWDKYLQSVNTSMNAQGTLNEKNDRYLESLEAHMQQLGTQAERTYDILFDENAVKSWVDALDGALGIFNDFISGLGGGTNAFAYFGTTVASVFNKQIAHAIQGAGAEIQRVLANINAFNTKSKVIEQIKSGLQVQYAGEGTTLGNTALTAQAEAAQKTLVVQKGLTAEQQKQAVQIQKQIGLETQKIEDLQKQQQKARQTAQELQQQLGYQKLTVQQIQKKKEFLEEQHALTLQTKNALDKVDITLKTQTATEQQKKILAKQISDEQQNIVAIFQQQNKGAQDLENKTNQFKDSLAKVQDYLNGGKTTVDEFNKAWNEVYGVVNKFNNDQITNISKTETLLQNLGIDTSKLTEEEKKKLAVLLQQNDALTEQGRKTLNLQTLVKGVSAAGMALTSIGGGLSTALADGATAADKLNGRFTAINGTIGALLTMIPGIGPALNIVWQGVSSIGKAILEATGVWDKFEDHFKSAKQKVDELNESISKVNQNDKTKNAQISNLEELVEEYEKLSEKAGDYGINLDNLTQQEQDRYHQITNSFAEYNDAVIAGYDEQGNAIVKGQDALKDTIKVLKQAKLQADKAALGDKDSFLKGISTKHTEENNKKYDLLNAEQEKVESNFENTLTEGLDLSGIRGNLDTFVGAFVAAYYEAQNKFKDLNNLTSQQSKLLGDQFKQSYQDFIDDVNTALNNGDNDLLLQTLKQASEYRKLLRNATGDKDLLNQYDVLFDYLPSDEEIQDYLDKIDRVQKNKEKLDKQIAKQTYSDEDANALITGLQIYDNETWSVIESKLKQIGIGTSGFINDLSDFITSQKVSDTDINDLYASIQQQAENYAQILISYGDSIKKAEQDAVEDAKTIFEKKDQTAKGLNQDIQKSITENFLNDEVIKTLLADAKDNPEYKDFLESLISSIYNIEDIKIEFDKEGNAYIAELQTQKDKINTEISKVLFSNDKITGGVGQYDNEILNEYLQGLKIDDDTLLAVKNALSDPALTFRSLQEAIGWVDDFIQQSDRQMDIEPIIEKFDKISAGIKKIQSDKNLNWKQKNNLAQALNLTPEQLAKLDSNADWLEKITEKVYTTLNPKNTEESAARKQAFIDLYPTLQALNQAYQTSKNIKDGMAMTADQYADVWNQVYQNELQQLNINEQALKDYAEAKGLAFEDKKDKEAALKAYQDKQTYNELGQALESVKEKMDNFNGSAEDAADSELGPQLQNILSLLRDLGAEDVSLQWLINNFDALKAAAEGDIEAFKELISQKQKLQNPQTETTTAVDTYNEDKADLSNLKGAASSLEKHTELSQDQSQALARAASIDQQLAAILNNENATSEQILQVVNQIIEAKERELQISKQQALQENADKLEVARKELEVLQSNAGSEADERKKQLQEIIISLLQQRIGLEQDLSQIEDKPKFDEDVDVQTLEHLSETIQQIAPESEELANTLAEDEGAADDLAQAILRFDDACVDVSKNYEDWMAALNSGSLQEQVQAMDGLRDAYADLLDLDGSTLSNDFLTNTENLDLMRAAIDGDTDAYDELMSRAGQDIITHLQLSPEDYTQFQTDLANVQAMMDEMNFQDIEIGASLDDANFIAGLENMINAAGMTAQQATDYLASMGVDAEVIEQKTEGTETKQVTGYHGEANNTQIPYDFVYMNGTSLEHYTGSITAPGVNYVPDTETVTDTKENSAFSLKVTSAHKSSGGNFKFSQAKNGGGSKGASRRSGGSGGKGRGGGKGGKGGGSGKAAEPDKSQKDRKKAMEDERDIYHDINIELEQINRRLDRTQKKQDRLYGKQLLDNLNKQSRILDQHKAKLEEKHDLQEQDLIAQQKTLKNLGVTFDKYGNIANYMDILGNKQAQVNAKTKEYNSLIDAYNKSTDKDIKKQISEEAEKLNKQIAQYEDEYKDLEDKIKNYDGLREDMEDLVDQIEEETQKQIEINIKKFRMEIEIRLDMGEAERDWNKFRREVLEHTNVIKDTDFQEIFSNVTQGTRDITSYFNVRGSKGSLQTLTEQLMDTRAEIEAINKTGSSAIYGDNKAQAMEDLQNDLKKLMEQMEDIQGLIDDVDKAYLDTIGDIGEQFDKQIDDYEYIGELIEHDIDLLSLIYGDKNYDAMNKYYEILEKNNLKQLDSLKQQRDFWKEQWDAAVARGDTQAAKQFEENYKETIKNLNETIEEAAKNLQDKYINAIDKIFDELDKKISNGKGTDYLNTEWELMNKNADEYLDTINTAFAIQETERKYQKALDETKSIKNQQALKKLMDEQLGILKNKEKVTQYDVDRAEKLLQVEQARIALQDAQSTKTSMRLKRDSQGNYSYEYVADNGAVDDAQDNLAQAQNDLYNFDKDRYQSNLDDMLSAWKDFQSDYKDILEDTSLTEQDRIEKLALLREQYGQYINDKTAENLVVRNNLMESAFADLAALYNTDVENYNQMSIDEQNILMGDLVPAWESGIQQMADKVAGEGGFIPVCEEAFENITEKTKDYEEQLDNMANAAGVSLDYITQGVNLLSDTFGKLIENNDELIDRMSTEVGSIQTLRDAANELVNEYHNVYNEAKSAVSEIHNFIQEEQKRAAAYVSTANVAIESYNRTAKAYSDAYDKMASSFENYAARVRSAASGGSSGGSGGSGGSSGDSGGSGGSSRGSGGGGSSSRTGSQSGTHVSTTWQNGKATQVNWRRDKKGNIIRLASGGYTGDWHSSEGRIAVLHQKQLVLNESDTKNILNSVSILRSMSDSVLGSIRNRNSNLNLANQSYLSSENGVEQNVHIEASFPNVDSKREIEEAFNDLVNLAAQRAMRR